MTTEYTEADAPKLTISSVEEALELLDKLGEDDFAFTDRDYENLEITGVVATLAIEINGPPFHGTITGGLARGLWHYQKEIYKAAAFAIYNNDNYGKIPRQELKNYTLVFDVDEGCTELIAKILDIGKSLVEKTMDGMTPKEKASLLLKITLAISGAAASVVIATAFSEDYYNHKSTVLVEEQKARQAEATTEENIERIKSEVERDRIQAQLVASLLDKEPVPSRFNAASAEGIKAIAKYSPEATALKFGNVELGKEQLEELNQRSSREIPDEFNIVGYYRVTSTTEPLPDGTVRVGLSGNGDDFTAYVDLNNEESPITDEQSDALFLAPKTGERLYMNVRIRRASDGIRSAYIESFPPIPAATASAKAADD
ncbi:hypothetical protein [Pusillimonas sp. NJUB218]|uniref:hypothetical protein n=1 Tax=Pusillimonas sp. NJUB218 TaxID=2023230 RepID=UPI000F4C0700|nr:hypothetical protein [Pusillimonas sp. NJUB218]ROT45034.1 hypothetical protein CHR62_09285 [Pusillimonas sp. NJUB218]